ncbi:MAG: DUF885 family protein [Gemmatimonadota bacterium]
MAMNVWKPALLAVLAATALPEPTLAQVATAQADAATVPSDLRPLLLQPQSELRLVVQRYELDRETMNDNYIGDGTSQRGRRQDAQEPPQPAVTTVSLSPDRIARLKRYDLDWQAALERIDAGPLTPVARADLSELKAAISANLAQLDADAAERAAVLPVLPFAPLVVDLVEARIRMEDVDGRIAAGVVTDLTRQIDVARQRLEAGVTGGTSADALRVDGRTALKAAAAADALRAGLTEWFNHYFRYDPMFSWWLEMPFGKADSALAGYATLLRDRVAPAALQSNVVAASAAIAPSAPPQYASVPDLQELISLPQDEMAAITERFRGAQSRSGRGGNAPPDLPVQFYRDWLTALEALDFDALSRNAQVDYLFIRRNSEVAIARAGARLPANPPRKTDDSGIEGPARGREGLILDLQQEMIPYSPEELMVLADSQFAWMEAEMKKAAREMGYGDDWKAAVEHVKNMHPAPGGQPALVRDMLFEAIDYLRARDLLTVPQVATESLHMIMMSPERQLVAPFFLGGSQIMVSYPTNTMDYDARLQSMRGNNYAFSHAVAHHEMIPGHNLTGYLGDRYDGYRASLASGSPFFSEGWAVYWELRLFDMGFHDTPEERVGAMFWLMHRAARIVFSLRFHMGDWSPQQSIDFLVDRVGHERDNATAEVRRSFEGSYGPLYQAAYLLGALQLQGLHRELVGGGIMTETEFHDEILRQGSMPVSLTRLALMPGRLTRDMDIDWKFFGEDPGVTEDSGASAGSAGAR